ncbi:unnamed protein product [Symbiodinium natans]|uniref:Uncharacterized protein n=1 Tax=Symbiodinium natans TaxID=878477 RepID=A0A812UG49_9DINO|nr:unnamed protein product [Symbiodinium natans]
MSSSVLARLRHVILAHGARPQLVPNAHPDSSDEESDEELDEAVREYGEHMGAEVVGQFLRFLEMQKPGEDNPDAALIQKGLFQAFDRMPPEKLAKLMVMFGPRAKSTPSSEEVEEFHALCQEIQALMPADAAERMQQSSSNFLEGVMSAMPGADITPQSITKASPDATA